MDHLAAFDRYGALAHARRPRAGTHVDAARGKRPVRGDAEALGQFEQQARLVLQQRHLELVRGNARVVAADAAQAVDQFAGGLDAGETAADDDEVSEATAHGRIGLELDLRDASQHHVADVHRVADGLERQRVLGHARNEIEPGAIAERQHEMLVGKFPLAGERRRRQHLACRVDRDHATHDEAGAREHLPDRCDGLLGKDRCAERLGQHRVERRVALLADQYELVAVRQFAGRARGRAWCRRNRRRR